MSNIMENFSQSDFINGNWGEKYYGVNKAKRELLMSWFHRNTQNIQSGTPAITHARLAADLLEIPPTIPGVIMELGCFKGASLASLSLIAEIMHRKILACDSYEGLPDDNETLHVANFRNNVGYYKKNDWCGSLPEVMENIRKFGAINQCEFIKGYFSESLKALKEPIIWVFSDIDLCQGHYDFLKYVYPLLIDGGKIWSDDAGDCGVIRAFFDTKFFKENFNCDIPGFVGSGTGLRLDGSFSLSLGYAQKINYNKISQEKPYSPQNIGLNKPYDFNKIGS